MEEKYPILVRPGYDTRTRVAIAHRSVAARRYSVIELDTFTGSILQMFTL